ncbi:MAG: hypothetical protein J0H64_07320 [Actinobacteria bacterium]|nr:hypothetical protein [Actinomycetota bacterium]
MVKRAALTVLVNNIYDHWKNHGFLRRESRWELVPSFDSNLSPTRSAVVSRALTPNDDPRNRDIRNFIDSRDAYALTAAEMATALWEVLVAVRSWPEVARGIGILDGEIRLMSGAFSEQQQQFCEAALGG